MIILMGFIFSVAAVAAGAIEGHPGYGAMLAVAIQAFLYGISEIQPRFNFTRQEVDLTKLPPALYTMIVNEVHKQGEIIAFEIKQGSISR